MIQTLIIEFKKNYNYNVKNTEINKWIFHIEPFSGSNNIIKKLAPLQYYTN